MSTVVYNLKNIEKKIKFASELPLPRNMGLIGEKVKEFNLDQIDKQKEATGSQVKPYSKEYVKIKGETKVTYISKKSTLSKGHRSGGHMMFAFGVVSKYGQTKIGFLSRTAKQKAKWNSQVRNFIGLTKRNSDLLFRWIINKFG